MVTFPIWPPREFTPSRNLCFVLMPFTDPRIAKVYRDVVSPALEEVKLAPNKADERYGPDVMQDIWAGLNEARLVLADVTGRNANVFYEVGIAHTLGKPLILLSADGGDAVPFDINRFRHVLYTFTPRGLRDLRTKLRSALPKMLREHPTGHRLVNEAEFDARQWRGPTRDSGRLYGPDRLNLIHDFTRPQDLSDFALAFCAASACQHALLAHMIYWGTLCSRRPRAAQDLAFGLFDIQRRPRLRIAHLMAQMPADVQGPLLAQMAEHKLDKSIREAIKSGDVAAFVRQRYRALGLTAGERDELLELYVNVRLARQATPRPTTTTTR